MDTPAHAMLPVRVYGARQAVPQGAIVRANVTSKAAGRELEDEELPETGVVPFPDLSPFHMGPVTVYPGKSPLDCLLMENGWQYSKLYAVHATADGAPTTAHARWMLEGIRADDPRRFPMGRGKKPLCSVWRDRRLGHVEARLLIYVPMYVEAICRSGPALRAYKALRTLHARASAAGRALALFDYDGYDHEAKRASLAEVAANPNKKMGHAFVLAALLEDRLIEVVRDAAELAGLEPPGGRDLPPDLSPFREGEQLPGLVGGAVVYYRHEFLNRLAARYFEIFSPGGAAQIPWERRTIMMFGCEAKGGHDTAFFGDPGTSYRYTGKDHAPLAWDADPTGALHELLEIVRLVTGKPFNFCLMNFYRPEDSIGKHSDDERDLVEDVGIFSVSLGRARRFCMEAKGGTGARGRPVSQRLAHGSVVWMAGLTQQAYKHYVDAEKMRPGELGPADRVNLTFRCVHVRR